MTVYATITDLIQREIVPAIATDDTLTGDQGDRIAGEVCTRLQAVGLVVWDDGYDEDRGAYWLPAQGFRMVDPGDDGATFWGIVAEITGQVLAVSDDDGADVDRSVCGFVCKRCGGPSPMGVGYVANGADAERASTGITRCPCGYSITPDADQDADQDAEGVQS